MLITRTSIFLYMALLATLTHCGDDRGLDPYARGGTTAPCPAGRRRFFDASSLAFENPIPSLDGMDLDRFLAGDAAFEQVFVTSPAEVGAWPRAGFSIRPRAWAVTPAMAGGAQGSARSLLLSVPCSCESACPAPIPQCRVDRSRCRALANRLGTAPFSGSNPKRGSTSLTLRRPAILPTAQRTPCAFRCTT